MKEHREAPGRVEVVGWAIMAGEVLDREPLGLAAPGAPMQQAVNALGRRRPLSLDALCLGRDGGGRDGSI